MFKNNITKLTAVVIIVFGLMACSDSGSGVEPPPKPTVPALGEVQPEAGYFQNNYPAGDSHNSTASHDYSNFNAAGAQVLSGAAILGIGQFYSSFTELARNNEAEFVDGKWVWDYSYSAEGQSVSISFSAEVNESTNETKWELRISSSGGEQNFNNYKFMEGTTIADGSSGSWKIFAFDPNGSSQPVLSFDWVINGEDDKSFTFTTDNNGDTFDIAFKENGPDHDMTILASDGSIDVAVYWNSNTQTGYIIENGEKSCWDANFQNTSCS